MNWFELTYLVVSGALCCWRFLVLLVDESNGLPGIVCAAVYAGLAFAAGLLAFG